MKGKKNNNDRNNIMCVLCVCYIQNCVNICRSVDDKVLYNGFLKAYEIPMLLEKKKMRVGFYKVSAKCNNIQVQHRFFYFFQKTIWIDFDFATNDILLVSKFYKQIPL